MATPKQIASAMKRMYNPTMPDGSEDTRLTSGACPSKRIIQDVDKFLTSTRAIFDVCGVVVPGLGSKNGWRNDESRLAGVNRGNWGGKRLKKAWPGTLWRHHDAEEAWQGKIERAVQLTAASGATESSDAEEEEEQLFDAAVDEQQEQEQEQAQQEQEEMRDGMDLDDDQ